MWRIEPLEEIIVSIKRNPGMEQHAECSGGGYTILSKNRVGMNEDTPSALHGKRHALYAEILKALQNEYCIIVSANQSRLMIPAPGNHFTGLAGPLVFGLTMAF